MKFAAVYCSVHAAARGAGAHVMRHVQPPKGRALASVVFCNQRPTLRSRRNEHARFISQAGIGPSFGNAGGGDPDGRLERQLVPQTIYGANQQMASRGYEISTIVITTLKVARPAQKINA
eukprot:6210801-Pleurochrysis_carterae.AAC.4